MYDDISCCPEPPEAMGNAPKLARVNCRLPTTTRPLHYDLAIRTNLESHPPSFSGEILATVEVTEPTREIVFNLGPKIVLKGMALETDGGASTIPLDSLVRDDLSEQVVVPLGALELAAGNTVRLWVQWEGEIGKEGYHRSIGDPDANGKRPV